MKILHVVTDLIRGGTEGQCARTAIGLEARGRVRNRVAVFFRQGFFLEDVERVCGAVREIPVRRVARIGTAGAVAGLARWMRAGDFDAVHTWDAEAAVFGGAAALLAGKRLITSRRDLGEIYSPWKRRVMRYMDRRAVRVVVNARAIGACFAREGLDESRIVHIPNVLDVAEFDRLASDGTAGDWFEGEGVRFVCVSRMDPEKGLDVLVRAFARYVEEGGGGTLLLVGDGMERVRLEALAGDAGLGGRVRFAGARSDVPALLARADAGILLPVGNEGLSNSILEYMAAGLPVICTDCGGNAELVGDGENGLLVQAGDVTGTAAAFRALEHPGRREAMGRAGRQRVERDYAPEQVLAQFEGLYESVC